MIFCNLLASPFSLPPRWAYALLFFANPKPNTPAAAILCPKPPQISARSFGCRCRRRGSSWDPNAEAVRGGRFKFRDEANAGEAGGDFGRRRWWSDNSSDSFEEESYLSDDEDDRGDLLWDKIWIFKVFRSYGFLLPAIIASMLLATGPKAFLMALALPLGQSAISLAIDKLWGGSEKERRPSHTTRRKPFSRSSVGFNKKANEASRDNFRRMEGYQTWVSAEDSSADKNNSKPPSFGGWDELDRRQSETNRSNNSRTNKRSTVLANIKMGKSSKKGRYGDSPLILRLIVAVFPFLGSWFKIL